jgi:four helix bundle protein
MPITSYRDLEGWQASMALVERCYALSSKLPATEQFNLGNQIRRAAVSIPANIAEGHRRSRKAVLNHLSIALGSQAELETLLEIGERLGFLGADGLTGTRESGKSVARQLYGLIRALDRS